MDHTELIQQIMAKTPKPLSPSSVQLHSDPLLNSLIMKAQVNPVNMLFSTDPKVAQLRDALASSVVMPYLKLRTSL